MTDVVLSGNSYSVEACAAIGEIVAKCPRLASANCSDMFIGRTKDIVLAGLRALCGNLVNCRELVQIDFSHNAIGSECVPGLQALLESGTSIKRAIFNNNGLGKEAGSMLASYMTKGGVKLTEFSAHRNRLKDGGF